ncbi:DUF4136 domain-containing protein [Roseateles violae]|uniref:DUF4136 domain-containing protein n=1 Tax=Roseateles violae TaxID=3058042 RepID=A0ABT8DZC8_9BURK|nr:DUF4136 domain-containing protein [Pelomonas sp. PFR6]MDN3922925.1 DUF4136 domain-containing protein [Pelomonas sp. PFR6]
MFSKRRSLLLGLTALTLGLAACASKPELSRIQDPDADFHAYRSFAVLPGRPDGSSSLVERRLIAAARLQMERRGYVLDESAPDLLVNVAAVLEDRQRLRPAAADAPGKEAVVTEEYRLGRLAVDLIDARRRDVVWHSTAEGRVSAEMLRDAGTAAEKAVAAVFESFPVKPKARVAASAPASR